MQYFLACGIALHFTDIRMAAATPHLVPPPSDSLLSDVSLWTIIFQYLGHRRSADMGQHLGCWKLYFYHMLTAESQEHETLCWSQCWIQGWTYQKCIMNSAHEHNAGDLPYEFNNMLPIQKYYTFLVQSNTKRKKKSKTVFCVHLIVSKAWAKTLLLLDLQSGWGLEKQEFRNKEFFSVCFQQNETGSQRGRQNNNGEDIPSEKWGENENVF